ncbi:MAG: tetratricopeptide repeat protein [Flavobacteriaceae bacterium]
MLNRIFLIICCLVCTHAYSQTGQNKIDSLQRLIRETGNDSLKIHYKILIGDEFRNINVDSAFHYRDETKKLIQYDGYLKRKWELFDAFLIAEKGEYKLAIQKTQTLIPYFENRKDNETLGIIHNSLGVEYVSIGEYDLAVDHLHKALDYGKRSNDEHLIARSNFTLGIVYFEIKEYEKSNECYQNAIKICEDINYQAYLVYAQNNLSNNYVHQKKYREAIPYAKKVIAEFTKTGKERLLSYPYVNLGTAYKGLDDYALSEEYYLKAIQIKKKNKDEKDLIITQGYLADLYMGHNHMDKAEKIALEAYTKAEKLQLLPEIASTSEILAKVYRIKEKFKESSSFFSINKSTQDSLFVIEKAKETFRLQTKYETAEKEKQILAQRAKIVDHQLALKNRNFWIFGLVTLAIIIGLIGFLLYKQQLLKNIKQQKDNELKLVLEKIDAQNRLQEQRLAISRDLHDNIGAQLSFIVSAIDTIKYYISDRNDQLTDRLDNIGIFARETIQELRDTIWAMNKQGITIKDLQSRIANFMEKAKQSHGNIRISFITDKNVPADHSFTGLQGLNIFRIVQEATNNALKYAEADQIGISIRKTGNNIHFSIQDNGKGFVEKEVEAGNGLLNMRKRAHELGDELMLRSGPDKGTVISFRVGIS